MRKKIFLVISEEDTICPECGSPLCRRDRKLDEFVTTSEGRIVTAHEIFNSIKIMEQPKYRFADLHLQSDKNYTDINDTIVGFLFDRDIIVPSDIQIRLEDIINNMLAEHFAETRQVLYPYDFEVSISMEMDTRTNKVIISTYIVNADDLNLHTEIDTDTLHDYGRTKKYFFNELGCIVLNRIGQLQKAANVKGWLAS